MEKILNPPSRFRIEPFRRERGPIVVLGPAAARMGLACSSDAETRGIISSRYGSRDIPSTTIQQEILAKCAEHGDRVCMIDGPSGKEWSFNKLAEDARALAGGLLHAGIHAGDRVAVYMPNCPEYFVIFHGILLTGAVVTTLNPTYGADELKHCLGLTKPSFLFTTEALFPKARAALAPSEWAPPQFVIQEERAAWSKEVHEQRSDAHPSSKHERPLSEMLLPDRFVPTEVQAGDLAVLPYSSGTTGLPKAVMLSHANIVSQLYQLNDPDLVHFTKDTVCLAVLPFFHIYGMTLLLEMVVWCGAKVVTMPKFEPALYLQCLKKYDVTVAHVAPPLVNFLAKHDAVNTVLPLPKLKELFCGAAPLDNALAEQAKERLGLDIVRQGYGMTEMSPASHVGPRSKPKGGSIGCLVPNMEMKIMSLDSPGSAAEGPGVEGEIRLRGPNVMMGYYQNEEATAETVDSGGWLHTGDVGYLDDDGQVWIVDRIKELIKVKGFQVAPAELEAVLLKNAKVADAAVIGVAAGQGYGGREGDGQVPKAYVVLKQDQTLSEQDVIAFVKDEVVAEYKRITAVEFVNAIPKSASGKILRKDLRKQEEAAGKKIFG